MIAIHRGWERYESRAARAKTTFESIRSPNVNDRHPIPWFSIHCQHDCLMGVLSSLSQRPDTSPMRATRDSSTTTDACIVFLYIDTVDDDCDRAIGSAAAFENVTTRVCAVFVVIRATTIVALEATMAIYQPFSVRGAVQGGVSTLLRHGTVTGRHVGCPKGISIHPSMRANGFNDTDGEVFGQIGPMARRKRLVAMGSASSNREDTAMMLTSERSGMVNREVVLFLLQLELDSQLQRALTYEDFDLVKDVRERRNKVDGALREMQKAKGYGCGSRRSGQSGQFGTLAPKALSIRAKLSKAIEEEDYSHAAQLRDELAAIEEHSAEANMPCPVVDPEFALGEMIMHNSKGYRGVICGWDLACCEDDAWKIQNNAGALKHGTDQVFYHVLVNIADWPINDDLAPVAYVPEEALDSVALADFDSEEPLVNAQFQHPYSYLMFLGTDGHGNMIPCKQLREKYCMERRDVYPSDWEDGQDDGSSEHRGPIIPGIDMSSLDNDPEDDDDE